MPGNGAEGGRVTGGSNRGEGEGEGEGEGGGGPETAGGGDKCGDGGGGKCGDGSGESDGGGDGDGDARSEQPPRSPHAASLESPQSLVGEHQAPAWQTRSPGQSAALAQA